MLTRELLSLLPELLLASIPSVADPLAGQNVEGLVTRLFGRVAPASDLIRRVPVEAPQHTPPTTTMIAMSGTLIPAAFVIRDLQPCA